MSTLTGNLISNTYQSLLKTANNNPLSASLVDVTDGFGNTSALEISTNEVGVTGSLYVTGTINIQSAGNGVYAELTDESAVYTSDDGLIGTYVDMHGIELFSGSNYVDISVNGNAFGLYQTGSVIAVSDNTGNPYVLANLPNYDNWNSGLIKVNAPVAFTSSISAAGLTVSGPVTMRATGSVSISGSLSFTQGGAFTLPTIAPGSPVLGSIYTDGTAVYVFNGSTWRTINFA